MPRECSEGQDGAGKSAREMLKASKRVQKIFKITKPSQGDYWARPNRISEITIEEFFGRLRVQSAQLTARGYFCASMRESLRQQRRHVRTLMMS